MAIAANHFGRTSAVHASAKAATPISVTAEARATSRPIARLMTTRRVRNLVVLIFVPASTPASPRADSSRVLARVGHAQSPPMSAVPLAIGECVTGPGRGGADGVSRLRRGDTFD